MTNEQLMEADQIFEATLDPAYRRKLKKCLADLERVKMKHGGAVFSDCLLRENAKLIKAAEETGERSEGEVWTEFSDDFAGNG